MHHKNPDCGNVELGEGHCPRCWRDNLTCDDKAHHFAENNNICDCRKLTRQMADSEAFSDSEGYEKWIDCEKHGAQKGLHCPKCEMVKTAPLTSDQVWDEAVNGDVKAKVKEHFKAILELIEDETYPARRNISDYVELIISNFHFEWREEFGKMAEEFYKKNDLKLRR